MAPKKINEGTQQVDETTAAASLSPGSQHPMPRVETLAAIVAGASNAKGAELTKWFTQMIDQIGHEADKLPAGANPEHNKSTIKMHGESVVAAIKEAMKEDLDMVFAADETLSEEFKTRTTTIFEAAAEARISAAVMALEEENELRFEEEINEAVNGLVERIDNYIDYSANKWLEENKVAVESALRNEISAEFIEGIKRVFEENYIKVPEEQVDVVDQLAQAVDEAETRLNDTIAENADLKAEIAEFKRDQIVESLSEGLTVVEKAKLHEMASTIDTTDMDAFKAKATVLKESTFVKSAKAPSGKQVLSEQLSQVDEDNKPEEKTVDPRMKVYVDAIRRNATR
jgi:hypothetical protein